MTNTPLLEVAAVRAAPVSTCVAVTVAPGMGARLSSITLPRSSACATWAVDVAGHANAQTTAIRNVTIPRFMGASRRFGSAILCFVKELEEEATPRPRPGQAPIS